MRLQLVGSVELARAPVHVQWTLVPLHRVVHQLVALQLVAPIEGRITDRTGERLLARVYDEVHLQVVGRLEALVAVLAVVQHRAVRQHVPPQVALAGKHLVTLGAREVV